MNISINFFDKFQLLFLSMIFILYYFKDVIKVSLVWVLGNLLFFINWVTSLLAYYPNHYYKFRGLRQFNLRSYNQIKMVWGFIVDNTVYENLFELPKESDIIQKDFSRKEPYLKYLNESVIPIAKNQTQAFSEYFERNFSKNYRSLFEFLQINFDFENEPKGRKALSKIVLPNQFWQQGEGACEDYAIFISSILCNWKIKHNIVVEVWKTNTSGPKYTNTFVETEGGFAFDLLSDTVGKSCKVRNGTLESRDTILVNPYIIGGVMLKIGFALLTIASMYVEAMKNKYHNKTGEDNKPPSLVDENSDTSS